MHSSLTLRPYQLLCIVCSIGEEGSGPMDGKLKKILETIRENPDMPITLRCNAGDVYVYQDPGTEEDTSEGSEYNIKRDLDILRKLDLAPGSTLPARTFFFRLLNKITTVSEICGYDTVTSDAWKGCSKAKTGNYEKGLKKGITAIIALRTEEEMAAEKKRSLEALYSAKKVRIRPHHLMCAVCQYESGTRPPYKEDNLPEFMDMVFNKNLGVQVMLVRGSEWTMCASCPKYVPKLNACINVLGSGGLSNEKRDVDVLQKLGLTYGSTMEAKDLYRLLFEKIPTTIEICRRDNLSPSVWWDECGEENQAEVRKTRRYKRGREKLSVKLS